MGNRYIIGVMVLDVLNSVVDDVAMGVLHGSLNQAQLISISDSVRVSSNVIATRFDASVQRTLFMLLGARYGGVLVCVCTAKMPVTRARRTYDVASAVGGCV